MHSTLLADEHIGKKILTKWFRLYFFTFLAAPVAYATRAILANKLSVDDVGIFYSVLWFITLISLYNDLWLTEALQYYMPKYRIEKKYNEYKTIFFFTLFIQVISGILIAALLYRWADRLAIHHFHAPAAAQLLKIFCIYFLGINFLQVITSFFTAFQNTFASSLTDFVRQVVILSFVLAFRLITKDLSVFTFSRGRIVGLFGALVVAYLIFRTRYYSTFQLWTVTRNKTLLSTQCSYAFRIWLSINAGVLLWQVDQQFIIHFLWTEQAWIYASYSTTLMIYGVLTGTLWPLLFPLVTELTTKGQREKFSMLQDLIYKYFSIFALSISGIFFAFWPEITSVFFGTKFAYSGKLVSYVAPFLTINMLMAINYLLLSWLGKVKQRVKFLVVALVVNIGLNIILIVGLHMGLLGAVLATICSRCILRGGGFQELYRYQPVRIERPYLIKNLLIISGLSFLLLQIKPFFFVSSNAFRFQNISYLLIAIVLYYTILGISNIQQVRWALQQFKTIKQAV